MTLLSRRRFLTISAAATGAVLLSPSASLAASSRWRGTALGAQASMRFDGLSPSAAAPVIAEVEAELARLENIFSLYLSGSEISRLNQSGQLDLPSADLLDTLSLSASIHAATQGAFDPTVQPLWLALAQGAPKEQIARARAQVGFANLRFDTSSVSFTHTNRSGNFGLTLNGIAQGAITDRIAALLRKRGMTNILIDMGEIAAIGLRADGSEWKVGIADENGAVLREISLSDRAVATSSTRGTMLSGANGHIVNPRNAAQVPAQTVSVSAPSAAIADGLSTALCLVSESVAERIITAFPGAKLEAFQTL